MNYTHWLAIISAIFSIGGASAYIRNIISGKTRPNRVTWSMWALAPLIGTAAAISTGADFWATSSVFLAGFMPLLVFIASYLNKKSYWQITLFDAACGFCSLLALIVWFFVDSPVTAILLAAIGDGFASLPTIIKCWKYPETETGLAYSFGLIGVILILPSIPVWNIENSAFQIYLLIANVFLTLAVYRKKILYIFSK
jgi:hypothetical protein